MGNSEYKGKKIKVLEQVESSYQSLFDISHKQIGGSKTKLGELCKGKRCILVVNTATE
jgi:hypothetical protein